MNFLYLKSAEKTQNIDNPLNNEIFGEFKQISPTGEDLLIYSKRAEQKTFFEDDNYTAFLQGYVRDPLLSDNATLADHYKSFVEYIQKGAADIQQRFSGIFSTFLICKSTGDIYLSADWTSLYPVYYYITEDNIIISSSIVAIATYSSFEIDTIGILQRIASGRVFNYGRRSIIKNARRLLWSERIKITPLGDVSISKEKGLFNISKDYLASEGKNLWAVIKKEYELALQFEKKINIAQSGGIDTRIVIAAIPDGKEIYCHTFGEEDYYEAVIAGRCARAKGGIHKCYPVFEHHFPSKETMIRYIKEVEGFRVNNYFSILENNKKSDEIILLGDMCEAITARKMYSLKDRKNQIRTTLRQYILKKPVEFSLVTSESWGTWESKVLDGILREQSRLDFSKYEISKEELYNATVLDLQDEFSFIRLQEIPYIELVEECYNWLHHEDGYQTLLCGSKFFAVPVSSSNKILQATSCVHPEYRINNRIVDVIFRNEPELKSQASIPLTHTPYVRLSAPNFLKLVIWALRSKADNFLIKRMKRKRNPHLRYRLMKSLNWPMIYQNEKMMPNLSEWFRDDYTGMKEKVLTMAQNRQNLTDPILTTTDIVAWGSTEIQYGLLKGLLEKTGRFGKGNISIP